MTSGRGGGIGNHRRTDEERVSAIAKSRSGSRSPDCAKFGVVPADPIRVSTSRRAPTVCHREASKSTSSANSARASISASSRKSHTLARRRSSRSTRSGASEKCVGYDLIIVYYIFPNHSILFKQPRRKHRSLGGHVGWENEIESGSPMSLSDEINMFLLVSGFGSRGCDRRNPGWGTPRPRLRRGFVRRYGAASASAWADR
jgi:hypothetical protein